MEILKVLMVCSSISTATFFSSSLVLLLLTYLLIPLYKGKGKGGKQNSTHCTTCCISSLLSDNRKLNGKIVCDKVFHWNGWCARKYQGVQRNSCSREKKAFGELWESLKQIFESVFKIRWRHYFLPPV